VSVRARLHRGAVAGCAFVLSVAAGSLACGAGGAAPAGGATGAEAGDAEGVDAASPALADGDAAPPRDGAIPGDGGSRCTATADAITCVHASTTIASRTVTYAAPLGSEPAAGRPAVVFFQGSFVPGSAAFSATKADAFGAYALTRTIAALLDRGYVVIAPDAASNGTTFWQTNIPPYATSWPGCADDMLMQGLLAAISGGGFGTVDPHRLYAMGISSGGFMTSRMAVSYAGKFRALVDHSASYATCGQTCLVPTPLPADHPPTLFLHGDGDNVAPISIVRPYLDALLAEGHEAKLVTDPDAGHEWLAAGELAVPDWFDSHP
jgi:poly(3-hydroxyoctanoate) depolymerase